MGKPEQPAVQEGVDLAIVLGYIATKDLATVEKKVAVLMQLGYSNPEMVKITGAKDQTIRNIKSQLAKEHGNNA